jgi:hypothetical protein
MNKYKKHLSIALILFGICWVARCATQLPEASATIKVVDDEGRPVEGAKVLISFMIPYNAWSTKEVKHAENHEGFSDKDGLFSARDGCKGDIGYVAKKEGYYDSTPTRYDYQGLNVTKTAWQPGNPELTAVLKKIINPVPMYAREVTLQIQELNTRMGYDLEAGDWVSPYGKGMHPDFVCYASRRGNTMYDFETFVQITFSNWEDGIQAYPVKHEGGNRLRSMQEAPDENYANEWSRKKSASPREGRLNWETDRDMNYLFRVRSKLDNRGNIVSANYGKIYGDIITGGEAAEKLWLHFTYYYNPDPQSRSLEFDTKRNLAKDAGRNIYLP